ncbi:hypothetical protein H6P81_011593 [Aristolochia fimbriata]|uniref:Uncharacterized protein n=1 Tax=Aristolochia fimbriata TaxID=158543 RepID=A0AAV7ERZ8_ARIFI|nr:hypothetical protein H6P81_011593 [Aristolochia fimbriata]
MSSTGFSYAHLYAQQKGIEERRKKREGEEGGRTGNVSSSSGTGAGGHGKRVHPSGGSGSASPVGKPGGA